MKRIFSLDVGGTEIKTGVASLDDGNEVIEAGVYKSCSDKSKQEIIRNFAGIFEDLIKLENDPLGIGLAFPGDFDYENGICLMKNVGKYDAIYGVDIKSELEQLFRHNKSLEQLLGKPIRFINDVTAFAVGACMANAEKSEKTLCICIGTGCGSAFLQNGRPVGEEMEGVPKKGWLYCLPYKDSIIDDYLSKRGLLAISQSVYNRPVEGLELSELAKSGDIKAIKCFAEFGKDIAEALSPIIKGYRPNRIIFGGQIAKSFDLFGEKLTCLCDSLGITLSIEVKTSQLALKGLTALF